MNAKIMSVLSVFLFVGFVTTAAHSEDKPAAESHEAHHPEGQAAPKADDAGKMDMGQMHEMMNKCMSMHKDGKMCDHEMMQKCEVNMDKGECQKMMKQAKTKTKADTKKK
jgi:hypothetical protein